MKRLVRQTYRWTLVVCLVGILSISPASAGWLVHQIQCGAPPVCAPVPVCATSIYSAPVIHHTAPSQGCCQPQPVCVPAPQPCCCEPDCCGDSAGVVMNGGIIEGSMSCDMCVGEVIADPIYSEPMVDGVISAPPLVPGDMSVGSSSDSGTAVESGTVDGKAVVEQPFDDVSSEPMIDSNPATEQVPPEPKPLAEKKSDAVIKSDKPKTNNRLGSDPKKTETVKAESNKPKAKQPAANAPSTDDIFGSDTPAPADKPATPSTDDIFGSDTPAPADKPATPSTDDIFGSDTPAPADQPPPADSSLDSLFDNASADTPTPADKPAPGTSEPSIDSLFDSAPATDAPATDAPATGTPTPDAPLDELFGTPPSNEPTPGTKPESNESFDDLFGTPSSDDSAAPEASESLDDLFGMPKEPSQPTEESKPTPSIEDLFGNSPASRSEELVSEREDTRSTSIDDLFGTPDEASSVNEASTAEPSLEDLFGNPQPKPQAKASIDDLFGLSEVQQHVEPASSKVPTSHRVGNYEGELPAPLVKATSESTESIANDEIKGVQVVSARSPVNLDPLAKTRVRVWIDNTGDFRTEGRLIEIGSESVRLLKSNGKTCTVPRDRLSEADAEYVSVIQTKTEAMPLAMVTPR